MTGEALHVLERDALHQQVRDRGDAVGMRRVEQGQADSREGPPLRETFTLAEHFGSKMSLVRINSLPMCLTKPNPVRLMSAWLACKIWIVTGPSGAAAVMWLATPTFMKPS